MYQEQIFYSLIAALLINNVYTLSDGVTALTDSQYAAIPPVFYTDDFDNCVMHDGPNMIYCMTRFRLISDNNFNVSDVALNLKVVSTMPTTHYRHDILRYGVCVSHACNYLNDSTENMTELLDRCYGEKFSHLGLRGSVIDANCQRGINAFEIDMFDTWFCLVMCAYILLVLAASALDYFCNTDHWRRGKKLQSVVHALSFSRNWDRLWSIDYSNYDIQKLQCIQGIRFFNMIFVLCFHTIITHLGLPSINPKFVEKMGDSPFYAYFANTGFIVMNNFMISIWLLMLDILKQKSITIGDLLAYIIKRYLRLLPSLAIAVFFNATWMRHLGSGPMWKHIVGKFWHNCRANGWSNILLLNNYLEPSKMCLLQTWSLSTDMQFFILAIVAWMCILKFQLNHLKSLFIVACVQMVAMGAYIYINNFESIIRTTPEQLLEWGVLENRHWIAYTSVISNFPGMLAGMLFGYYYMKYKHTTITIRGAPVLLILIFLCTTGNIVYGSSVLFANGYEHDIRFAIAYGIIGRLLFVFAIGLMTFIIAHGYGGYLKQFLEWTPFYILGRLSYAVLLIHSTLTTYRMGSLMSPMHISYFNITMDVVAIATLSYLLAVPFTLLIELPLNALCQTVLVKSKTKLQ